MAAVATVNEIVRRDRHFGWFMTAPGLAALVLVVLFPLFFTIFTSMFEYTLVRPGYDTFVGIDN